MLYYWVKYAKGFDKIFKRTLMTLLVKLCLDTQMKIHLNTGFLPNNDLSTSCSKGIFFGTPYTLAGHT